MFVCEAPVCVCAFAKKINNEPSAEDNFSIVDVFLRWFPLHHAFHQQSTDISRRFSYSFFCFTIVNCCLCVWTECGSVHAIHIGEAQDWCVNVKHSRTKKNTKETSEDLSADDFYSVMSNEWNDHMRRMRWMKWPNVTAILMSITNLRRCCCFWVNKRRLGKNIFGTCSHATAITEELQNMNIKGYSIDPKLKYVCTCGSVVCARVREIPEFVRTISKRDFSITLSRREI